jgi:signal transduction histidine kinase
MNVVRNAIRYTAPGTSVEIVLDCRMRDWAGGPGARARSRPGIPKALLADVFLPFRRGERSRGGTDGAGLGLAIADRVVRIHGGTIRAANTAGGGLTIEMVFPTAC